ncbi:MAG: thioredoxin domain-containing protein [Myxococcaceae bacterium]
MKANSTSRADSPVSPRVAGLLLWVSFSAGLLALLQWMELRVLRAGGDTFCGVSDTVNCARVWDSPLAARIHQLTGLPVAGLGLVWAVALFGAAVFLVMQLLAQRPIAAAVAAVRASAAAGLFGAVFFALASILAGGVCLTCVATYGLAVLAGGLALVGISAPLKIPPTPEGWRGIAVSCTIALGCYLALLLTAGGRPPEKATQLPTGAGLVDFVSTLSSDDRRMLSQAMGRYMTSAQHLATAPVRNRLGSASATLHVVEFTDILCPHCRRAIEMLAQVRRQAPAGSFSTEARQYPLDKACNPKVSASDGTGVRCLAAKVQICLETAPDFWDLRERLFAAQEGLSVERVLQVASSGQTSKAALEKCIGATETADRLAEDIRYAEQYQIRGTPLLLANGREILAIPELIYALALAEGKPERLVLAGIAPQSAQPQ